MVDPGHLAHAVRGPQNTKKLNLFRVHVSLISRVGSQNLVEQASFLNEKAALATLGWQIKEREMTWAFSCLRDGGWEFFLVVSDAMGKIFHLLKRSCVVVVQIAQLWLASMKTISCVQYKESFLLSLPNSVGTDVSLC